MKQLFQIMAAFFLQGSFQQNSPVLLFAAQFWGFQGPSLGKLYVCYKSVALPMFVQTCKLAGAMPPVSALLFDAALRYEEKV